LWKISLELCEGQLTNVVEAVCPQTRSFLQKATPKAFARHGRQAEQAKKTKVLVPYRKSFVAFVIFCSKSESRCFFQHSDFVIPHLSFLLSWPVLLSRDSYPEVWASPPTTASTSPE
jgi:hypothetical protein